MKIKKQKISLPVVNHDIIIGEIQFKKFLFGGGSKGALLIGPSNYGKTNAILSLIEHPNGLRFENSYIYSKYLYQSKYDYLLLLMEALNEIGYNEYNDDDTIISPQGILPNSVIIFYDFSTCNQNIIKNYVCFGRHKSTDCFYLCQTYSTTINSRQRQSFNSISTR